MKKVILLALLIFVISLTSCNKSKESEAFQVGDYSEYSFGIFTISGFKRDNNKLYFSYEIDPKVNDDYFLSLDQLSYSIHCLQLKVN